MEKSSEWLHLKTRICVGSRMNKVDELIDTLTFNIQDEWNDKLETHGKYQTTAESRIKDALLYYCIEHTDGMIDDEDELKTEKFIIKRWNKLSSDDKRIARELFDEFDGACERIERIRNEQSKIHHHRA